MALFIFIRRTFFQPSSLLLVGLAILVAFVASSCDSCRRLAKSKNIADKDSAAACYYYKKQYESASLIYEELMGLSAGTTRGTKAMFNYAQCKYALKEYITAAHFFKRFLELYPNDPLAEESTYMAAKSYYNMSATVELDQSDTDKALEYLQLFVTQYPESSRVKQINEYVDKLRDKLAEKDFLAANLYYQIYNYRSAIVAFKNHLSLYPSSKRREEAYFKLFESAVLFADNSVERKKEERYGDAAGFYLKFVEKYPQSPYLRQAEKTYERVLENIEKLKNAKPVSQP